MEALEKHERFNPARAKGTIFHIGFSHPVLGLWPWTRVGALGPGPWGSGPGLARCSRRAFGVWTLGLFGHLRHPGPEPRWGACNPVGMAVGFSCLGPRLCPERQDLGSRQPTKTCHKPGNSVSKT